MASRCWPTAFARPLAWTHEESPLSGLESPPAVFDITSGYGIRTRRPMVAIVIHHNVELDIQIAPAQALLIAYQLVAAAMASIGDAALVELVGGEGLTTEEVGAMLLKLRRHRDTIDEREGMSSAFELDGPPGPGRPEGWPG